MSDGGILKILSFNASAWTNQYPDVLERGIAEMVTERNADFVFLCELAGRVGQTARIASYAGYPFHGEVTSYPHHHPNLAVGFLSRIAVKRSTDLPLFRCRQGWHRGIKVVLDAGNGLPPWTIYGAHFWNMDQVNASPWKVAQIEYALENPRTYQAALVLKDMTSNPGASILAGDLNTLPWSRAYRILMTRLKDSCPLKYSISGTYAYGWVLPRLDYILHTRDLRSQRYRRISTEISDHLPIEVELRA